MNELAMHGHNPTVHPPDAAVLERKTERHAVETGGRTMIAAISLMRRQDSIGPAQFRRHWLDIHGPRAVGFPRFGVTCNATPSPPLR